MKLNRSAVPTALGTTDFAARVKRVLVSRVRALMPLPAEARAERKSDHAGLQSNDPGSELVLPALMDWLCRAQDCSSTGDGGVARHYSLISGWGSSYPETTGYIIPTFLEYARITGQTNFRTRAQRMADWLVDIQLPCGGFQGGKVDSTPVVPVTFNTGQILLGLAAAEATFGGYQTSLRRAADWLVETQDADGCWRKHPSPFAPPGDNVYDTHVAWGLFEAARIDSQRGYGDAGLANVRWALSHQSPNGWFAKCNLGDASRPLTHTIGYALRGVLEAFRFSDDSVFLEAARLTADGLITAQRSDGFLPGCLLSDWSAAADSACLTGSAQIAHCWMLLFQHTHETRYAEAAFRTNRFVRRTVRLEGSPEIRGGVKGSFPVDGDYASYEYPNWAAKFLADSLMLEAEVNVQSDQQSTYRETTS